MVRAYFGEKISYKSMLIFPIQTQDCMVFSFNFIPPIKSEYLVDLSHKTCNNNLRITKLTLHPPRGFQKTL